MFLTASPLMGRWIVASCEIYLGIRIVINGIAMHWWGRKAMYATTTPL